MLSLGLQRKQVVERGDTVDAAWRQLQAAGDVMQHAEIEEAEQLLGLVQHLDQRVGLILVTLHGHVQNPEALVPAGVVRHGHDPSSLTPPCRMAAGTVPAVSNYHTGAARPSQSAC